MSGVRHIFDCNGGRKTGLAARVIRDLARNGASDKRDRFDYVARRLVWSVLELAFKGLTWDARRYKRVSSVIREALDVLDQLNYEARVEGNDRRPRSAA